MTIRVSTDGLVLTPARVQAAAAASTAGVVGRAEAERVALSASVVAGERRIMSLERELQSQREIFEGHVRSVEERLGAEMAHAESLNTALEEHTKAMQVIAT